jgi:hypothetical protein
MAKFATILASQFRTKKIISAHPKSSFDLVA